MAVLFLLFNAGVPHADLVNPPEPEREDTFASIAAGQFTAVRRYVTDDHDLRRYFAYCNALLGRPYHGFYVRPMSDWHTFHSLGFAVSPDESPENVASNGPMVPYRDYVVEYPPGFFLVAIPPALLTQDSDLYRVLFGVLMALLLTAAVWVAWRLTHHIAGPEVAGERLLGWAAVCVGALGAVATHRYDGAMALALCLMSLATFERRPVLLGVATAFGIGTKLIPLIVAPIFLLYLLRGRRYREVAVASVVTVALVALIMLPGVLAAGSAFFEMFRYHGERPLQIESTAAAALALWHFVDPDSLEVVQSFGSTNVVGAYTDIALKLLPSLTTFGLLGTYLYAWIGVSRERDEKERNLVVVRATVVALVVFMTAGKTFSPQYLVWLVPLGVLVALQRGRSSVILLAVVFGATQLIFPVTYGYLQQLNPLVCALVLLRNVLLCYWAAHLLRSTHAPRAMPAEVRGLARTHAVASALSRSACAESSPPLSSSPAAREHT